MRIALAALTTLTLLTLCAAVAIPGKEGNRHHSSLSSKLRSKTSHKTHGSGVQDEDPEVGSVRSPPRDEDDDSIDIGTGAKDRTSRKSHTSGENSGRNREKTGSRGSGDDDSNADDSSADDSSADDSGADDSSTGGSSTRGSSTGHGSGSNPRGSSSRRDT